MLGAGVRRRQEKKDKVDWPAVDRLIVDRLPEAREQAVDPRQPLDLCVGDRNALAEAGRAKLLALIQSREHGAGVEPQPLRDKVGQLLEQRSFVAAGKRRLDRIAVEEIGKLHKSGTRWCDQSHLGRLDFFGWDQSVCGSTQPMFPSSRR